MSLAFRFLASPQTTSRPSQHSVHPFSYWFSHQRSNDALFRSVSFPDVVARPSETFKFVEADFLAHTPRTSSGYAAVVTLFFIDTAPNILATLQQIHKLLRPGGTWINLGPLLWPTEAALEPCLEEVWGMCREVGFEFVEGGVAGEETTRVRCEYTRDREAMMRWIYEAEFWVAKKSRRGSGKYMI